MKKLFFSVLIVFATLSFIIDVDAEEKCTSDELRILKVEAQNIVANYEFAGFSQVEPALYYYNLKIVNFSDNVFFKFGNFTYTYDDVKNGELFLEKAISMGGYKINIGVYASDETKCAGELLRTISLSVPHYNKYAGRDECRDYKDYDLCNDNSDTSNITEKDFLNMIEKIKNGEIKPSSVEMDTKEENDVFAVYWKNRIFTIPFTILLILMIVVAIIYFIKKNKEKAKIDLGDKI